MTTYREKLRLNQLTRTEQALGASMGPLKPNVAQSLEQQGAQPRAKCRREPRARVSTCQTCSGMGGESDLGQPKSLHQEVSSCAPRSPMGRVFGLRALLPFFRWLRMCRWAIIESSKNPPTPNIIEPKIALEKKQTWTKWVKYLVPISYA